MDVEIVEQFLSRNPITKPHFVGVFNANELFQQAVHQLDTVDSPPSVFVLYIPSPHHPQDLGHFATLAFFGTNQLELEGQGDSLFLDSLGKTELDYPDTEIQRFVGYFSKNCDNLSGYPPLQNPNKVEANECGFFSLYFAHKLSEGCTRPEQILEPFLRFGSGNFDRKKEFVFAYCREKYPYARAELCATDKRRGSSLLHLDPQLRDSFCADQIEPAAVATQ
jgi:hypothetical protein